jgi:hypothetical protein
MTSVINEKKSTVISFEFYAVRTVNRTVQNKTGKRREIQKRTKQNTTSQSQTWRRTRVQNKSVYNNKKRFDRYQGHSSDSEECSITEYRAEQNRTTRFCWTESIAQEHRHREE